MAEENKKIKLEVELDRDTVVATLMLARKKLTDEIWGQLTKETIQMDFSKLGEDKTMVKMALAGFAIVSLKI